MIKSIGISAAVLGVAALAACGSSSSSTSAAPKTVTGTEHVTGAVSGKAAAANSSAFSLTWSGPVSTTGTFNTSGPTPKKGQHHTFTTKAGDLVVVVSAKPSNRQSAPSLPSCKVGFATTVPFNVVGSQSTGKFKGATGSGTVAVVFGGNLPKANGKCPTNPNTNPIASTVHATFTGTAHMTVK